MSVIIDPARWMAVAALVLAYGGMCLQIARQHRRRQERDIGQINMAGAFTSTAPIVIGFASQTGSAEELAWHSARQLQAAGQRTEVLPLSRLSPQRLAAAQRALFIVSTCGEGAAPDNAASFVDGMQDDPRTKADRRIPRGRLRHLQYGLLALGDRDYKHFCGFGRALDGQLQDAGAQPMFARIEVSQLETPVLQQWQAAVQGLAQRLDAHASVGNEASIEIGIDDVATHCERSDDYGDWTLVARTLLNPGSSGEAVFLITLSAPTAGHAVSWEAGDLALVLPPGLLRAREYSLASIPADGNVQLLVRQARHANGAPGLCSGWLTSDAPLQSTIKMRLRRNAAFHIGANQDAPLILIGNGTGLAGLRAHLKTRATRKAGPNWLLFGERQADFDSLCANELRSWESQGVLSRTDLAFSRDQGHKVYVQDKLRAASKTLREWVQQGACIYVCGSRLGMAAGVEDALLEVLGGYQLQTLKAEGRYRRDVY